ncbi:tetratricopeptide repeat protein [Atopomonas sediminilitoris]|uniref:tetratricopeptide repeat protein n=1 Tax=Atopomonas sediminilitoris TaxID=2919919 RepID=UPI001F4D3833|nr:tetratricopeptide repeat protein [Atopomonas sediminilitoris]MCJ8168686.1 tetratricopeptide repeat protein [Atopomonas sediminilitoris]
MRYTPLLLICVLLTACAPTTPLFIAQVTTHEVEKWKELKSNKMAAALEDEGDLFTYSAKAIRDNKSAKAEELFMSGYYNTQYSTEVRAIALYQVGLIYMSRYNDERDDQHALNVFYKLLNEFPASRAAERTEARILMIRQRAESPVQKTSRELLARWKPKQDLDLNRASLDPDLTLLSRRAILKDRVDEAEELFLLALADPAVQASLKQNALFQLGLMQLAADNPRRNRDKGIGYLRRLLVQYPDSPLASKASRHIDRALNQQP